MGAGTTRSGLLVRSDHLGRLTRAGQEQLRAYGITTVVDLRSASELAGSPNPFAAAGGGPVRYVHRQLIDDGRMNNIGEAGDMMQRYIYILTARREAFGQVFTVLAEAEGGALFHCFAGKDRTGLIAAMLLSLAGVQPAHIAEDYCATDLQLAKQYETWIAEAPPERREAFRDELHCPPDRILGVLDFLDAKWGGVATYLEAAGVSPGNIDRLSSRLA